MPELRKDPIINRWVIIATERARRPSDYIHHHSAEHLEKPVSCSFCPGKEHETPPEVMAYRQAGTRPDTPGWWIRAVPNKFPALSPAMSDFNRKGHGMYDMMNGVGVHEVIIETPDHNLTIAQMPIRQVQEILWAYRDRFLDLMTDQRIRYILIFKNHGASAGASLSHPHSQLIATPIVPRRVAEELEGSRAYYNFKERCVFCDVITQELLLKERIILENNNFIAIQPFAARFPFETWIIPKRHSATYHNIDKNQIMDLALILKGTLAKLYKALDDPPFNYILHTAPFPRWDEYGSFYHWHIEIMPRLTLVAGFEWGTGMYINPTPPEVAANELAKIEVEI